jgi:hydrogenase expression/formation protein HypC
MCLAIPGQVLSVAPDELGMPMGQVSFGGIERTICLAYTPEVVAGDYVLVHIGFALQRIDEDEAQRTLAALEAFADPQELANEMRTPIPDADHEVPG